MQGFRLSLRLCVGIVLLCAVSAQVQIPIQHGNFFQQGIRVGTAGVCNPSGTSDGTLRYTSSNSLEVCKAGAWHALDPSDSTPSGNGSCSVTGSGPLVRDTVDQLPQEGVDVGVQVFVEEVERLYVWDGEAWQTIPFLDGSGESGESMEAVQAITRLLGVPTGTQLLAPNGGLYLWSGLNWERIPLQNEVPSWTVRMVPEENAEKLRLNFSSVYEWSVSATDPEDVPIRYSVIPMGMLNGSANHQVSIPDPSVGTVVLTTGPRSYPDPFFGEFEVRATDGKNVISQRVEFLLGMATETRVFEFSGQVESLSTSSFHCASVVHIHAFGAGGGASGEAAEGGDGGYTWAKLPMSEEIYSIVVGEGGSTCNCVVESSAGGGGYTGIFSGETVSQLSALVISGGGGGSARQTFDQNDGKGRGGGLSGEIGAPDSRCYGGCGYSATAYLTQHPGGGATQSSGGAAGVANCGAAGVAGTPLQGGDGGANGNQQRCQRAFGGGGAGVTFSGHSNWPGGGGGGGWFGGGSGVTCYATAGGGGSGYVHPSLPGVTTVGLNTSVADYITGVGAGGTGSCGAGGHGLLIVTTSTEVAWVDNQPDDLGTLSFESNHVIQVEVLNPRCVGVAYALVEDGEGTAVIDEESGEITIATGPIGPSTTRTIVVNGTNGYEYALRTLTYSVENLSPVWNDASPAENVQLLEFETVYWVDLGATDPENIDLVYTVEDGSVSDGSLAINSTTGMVRLETGSVAFADPFVGNFSVSVSDGENTVSITVHYRTGHADQTVVFSHTGSAQHFPLDTCTSELRITAFGGGGGCGGESSGSDGGTAVASVSVASLLGESAGSSMVGVGIEGGLGLSERLVVVVGGGGSMCGCRVEAAGSGGGLSGVFNGSVAIDRAIVVAGGGGGASRTGTGNSPLGGSGGGTEGVTGRFDSRCLSGSHGGCSSNNPSYQTTGPGRGGTQSAGGLGGVPSCGTAGLQGGALVGGDGGAEGAYCDAAYGGGGRSSHFASSSWPGGAGGGGYYGGGGGANCYAHSGGGGSGYLHPTVVIDGELTAGIVTSTPGYISGRGIGQLPYGSFSSCTGSAGEGLIVIESVDRVKWADDVETELGYLEFNTTYQYQSAAVSTQHCWGEIVYAISESNVGDGLVAVNSATGEISLTTGSSAFADPFTGSFTVTATRSDRPSLSLSRNFSLSLSSFVSETVVFSYTGGDQTYTVPEGADSIAVFVYGAGGGPSTESPGANGGYARAKIPVSGSTPLTIRVGQGGSTCQCNTPSAGGGGGLSGVFLGAATPSQGSAVVVAGGGGGASRRGQHGNPSRGRGGGLSGERGAGDDRCLSASCVSNWDTAGPGQGGTQSAGGAGGAANCGSGGAAGGALQGGDGALGNSASFCTGAFGGGGRASNFVTASWPGGGGGAGYYGGGGGANCYAHSGGGGSGYLDTGVVDGHMQVSNSHSDNLPTAVASDIGQGGTSGCGSGGNGLVIIVTERLGDSEWQF